MAIIKAEDVVGYIIGEECMCIDCATKNEEADVTQNEIITRDVVEDEDELYFCDRCNEKIA